MNTLLDDLVVYWDNNYHMWFAHRGTKDYTTYRIGYASSTDGIKWKRKDENMTQAISEKGWDSDSIYYPYMISHKIKKFIYCKSIMVKQVWFHVQSQN